MAHEIELPQDKVLSTISKEWHGLAEVVDTIDDDSISPLLFPIREAEMQTVIDGEVIPLPNYKTLVADLRHRPELVGTIHEFAPLHIPKNSYQVIDNRAVWEALKEATKDLDVKIVTAGTLGACKRFFVSVDIGNSEMIVNGDKFLSHLNFITSHDGTLAMQAYDSNIRIVCQNTLRWSLESAGEVGFKVYHSKNAGIAMVKLPELLENILKGREEFKQYAEYLNDMPITEKESLAVSMYYLTTGSDVDKLSTRTLNSAQNIVELAKNGIGNKGKTRYDLLNGATQYWTSGDGVGKKSSMVSKYVKANYGTAADHKNKFVNILRMTGDDWDKAVFRGNKVLSLIA